MELYYCLFSVLCALMSICCWAYMYGEMKHARKQLMQMQAQLCNLGLSIDGLKLHQQAAQRLPNRVKKVQETPETPLQNTVQEQITALQKQVFELQSEAMFVASPEETPQGPVLERTNNDV